MGQKYIINNFIKNFIEIADDLHLLESVIVLHLAVPIVCLNSLVAR